MATVKLTRGSYYAGIDRPWYVSKGAVRDEARKRIGFGFGEMRFFKRSTPLPVNPKLDNRYSDTWDEWVEVTYTAADRVVELDRVWAWLVLVRAKPGERPATVKAAPEPDAAPGFGVLVLLAPLAGLWCLFRGRRSQ
jgi:hypothetical protein